MTRSDLYQGPRALGRLRHRSGVYGHMLAGVRGVVPRSQLGADFSFAKLTARQCTEFLWIMGYLSTDPRKILPQALGEEVHGRGGGVALVWQNGKADVLGGAAKGREHVLEADNQYRDRHRHYLIDSSVPIRFATDVQVTSSQRRQVEDYYRAVCGYSRRPVVSAYGPDYVLDWLYLLGPKPAGERGATLDADWQCTAWSGGRRSERARALQLPGAPHNGYPGGTAIDENLQVGDRGPFPVWRRKPAPVPPVFVNRAVGIAAAP